MVQSPPPTLFFLLLIPRPPRSTLFPYTTLFRSTLLNVTLIILTLSVSRLLNLLLRLKSLDTLKVDRKSGSAGMPRPISYAVFCLKKKKTTHRHSHSAAHS